MSILITGGAGYIGSHTVLAFLEKNYDVIVLDNYINSSCESLKRVSSLTGHAPVIFEGDVRDRQVLNTIFTEHNITHVIHFAGLKSVSESVANPIEYYDNNVVGSLVLIDEMRKRKINNFIFSSSATVYGNPEFTPLTESCHVGGTTNPYGTSKFMVERILLDLVKADPEFNITILRYFNPVGAHLSGQIGEDPNGIPNNLLPYITQVAIGKLESLSVFGNDYPTEDGTGVRDYIHVMDLAEGHLAALQAQNNNSKLKIYNLGTGKGYSVIELIHAFEEVSGQKINFKFVDRRPGDIAECWSDPTLAKQELQWEAKRDLKEMMSSSWNWQYKNPNGYN